MRPPELASDFLDIPSYPRVHLPDRKHFNDVVRVVTHDFYCCRLLDLSLLHLLCTGGCLAKRVLCVVERGVRWYIDLSGQPCSVRVRHR